MRATLLQVNQVLAMQQTQQVQLTTLQAAQLLQLRQTLTTRLAAAQ